MIKDKIREEALDKRRSLPPWEREEVSIRISGEVTNLPEYKNASSIGLYAPKFDEVSIWAIMEKALNEGKLVSFPQVKGKSLVWRVVGDRNSLRQGSFGLFEPTDSSPQISLTLLDIIFVPGVAFDGDGNRIGFGKGYYDRTLKGYGGRTVGLAFGCQMFENLPVDKWDIKLDRVVSS